MQKRKINITMDQDLIIYAKLYATKQRTTASEVFTQFILNLKRVHEADPMRVLLDDPGFQDSLLETMVKIQSGETKWLRYDENLLMFVLFSDDFVESLEKHANLRDTVQRKVDMYSCQSHRAGGTPEGEMFYKPRQ